MANPATRARLDAQYRHLGEVRLIAMAPRGVRTLPADRLPGPPTTCYSHSLDWVQHTRGHSPAAQQRALLEYVRRLLLPGAKVVLVGDADT